MEDRLDIIIIGGGPIGLACGIEAEKRNLSYLILDKGCLVNSIYNYPANMTFFSTSERLEIGGVPFISHGVKPTRTEALEYYRRVKVSWNLKINLYETVENITGVKGDFKVDTSKESYTAKNIILCTGYYDFPNLMNIEGEGLKKVKHYYDEPHPYAEKKIIVVGGGNSAVDVALETYRRGAEVTMVVKKNELDKGVKYWVRPDIENRLKEDAVKSFFNSTLSEIREYEVDIETPGGKVTIENDFVLAMTGYHPDFELLKNAGINLKSDYTMQPEFNEETFETNISGLYLAGVVCGGMETGKWFIENSRYHAENIFGHITEEPE
jgi:thioredoxin reductase (NADPH)